jgi:hypothetical protein
LAYWPKPGKKRERKIKQAAKHSLHKLRKRRHIGPKCRESLPPKEKRKLVGIWRVAGSPLPQTETLRATSFFKCALAHNAQSEHAKLRAVLWALCESRLSSFG